MTRTTNARIAGITFLIYIVAGIASMILSSQTSGAESSTDVGIVPFLSLFTNFSAMVLAVTLYSITRVQDPDLAMLAMICRVAEGVIVSVSLSAIFFAVGSLLFAWLLLRGRMIPVKLAWLGVFASALLVLILPLQRAGLFGEPASWSGMVNWLMWMPMLVFEVVLAFWFIIKGVTAPKAPGEGFG